jgi:hypothetical protein
MIVCPGHVAWDADQPPVVGGWLRNPFRGESYG